jgi:hypothetical protein
MGAKYDVYRWHQKQGLMNQVYGCDVEPGHPCSFSWLDEPAPSNAVIQPSWYPSGVNYLRHSGGYDVNTQSTQMLWQRLLFFFVVENWLIVILVAVMHIYVMSFIVFIFFDSHGCTGYTNRTRTVVRCFHYTE